MRSPRRLQPFTENRWNLTTGDGCKRYLVIKGHTRPFNWNLMNWFLCAAKPSRYYRVSANRHSSCDTRFYVKNVKDRIFIVTGPGIEPGSEV